jgi:anti-sigma B factor antagonist
MPTKKSLLDVHTDPAGAVTVVRVSGVLDVSTVEELGDMVRPQFHAGAEVLMDFSGVTLCDSTGLGAVVRLERRARATGCSLAVVNPRPHVAEVFAMTGIDQVVRVIPQSPP